MMQITIDLPDNLVMQLKMLPDMQDFLAQAAQEKLANLIKNRKQTEDNAKWQVIEDLVGSVDMPSDWSLEHDHYLYDTPKKST